MTPQQKKTAVFLLVSLGIMFLLGVAALVWEGYAVAMGGHSVITNLMRLAFAAEPGAIAFVSFLVGFGSGGLYTHFFWAGKATYEHIKEVSK